MTNTITAEQLKELLEIQKTFDDRIPTLNLVDSKVAFIVEFFEWFNTLETFKNWKKNPGKPLDIQLDELADMLAFGLSIANQMDIDECSLMYKVQGYDILFTNLSADGLLVHLDYLNHYSNQVPLTFGIAEEYYAVDQLIAAYKKKMQRNHDRQDGKADTDKGYV